MTTKTTFSYPGEKQDVTWDSRLCIHVAECGKSEGELFVGGRKPWCSPDAAKRDDEVLDVIQRCPSGALAVLHKDGKPSEAPSTAMNKVVVSNDGPLYASGRLELSSAAADMTSVKHRAALCRCGQSKNKPFCDNSHREANFEDAGAVGERGPGAEDNTEDTLNIKTAKNGPLLLNGSFEIVTGSGRTAWRGAKAALCRCGQSKNKPFCDGTHSKVGFEAE